MNKLILPFLNPKEFVCGDKPKVWRKALDNLSQYVNWDTVTHCFNNPWYYRTQILNMEGRRLMLPEKFEVWYEQGVAHKEELFQAINEGHTFIIEQYGHYNPAVDNLLENIEAMFDCNCDAHIFGSAKEGSKSFGAHWDLPPNFICQIEGETHWNVFEERCSALIEMTDEPYLPDKAGQELTIALDVTLSPGDVMYIPARTYHKPFPGGKRLSMSIPCMYPRDVTSDRKQYVIEFDTSSS